MPVIESHQDEAFSTLTKQTLIILGLVLAVKILLLALDPTASFHFDDSGAYLATAIINYIPLDRSFLYGLLLRPSVRVQSLIPVVVAQVLLSVVSCTITGFCLLRYFRLSFRFALLLSLVCSVEPLQLSMERFIMTETVATFAFACFLCAGFEYLRCNKLWWLATAEVSGAFLVGIRVSYLPIVLVSTVLLPVLSLFRRNALTNRLVFRSVAIAFLFSICFSQALLFGYRHWYAELADKFPAYNYRDGEFLLADFAPLIQARDFADPTAGGAILSRVKYPISDPDMREAQHWMTGGLVDSLKSVVANEDVASAVAKKAVENAVMRDPQGALRLFGFTFRRYFSPPFLHQAIQHEEYQLNAPMPLSWHLIKSVFGVDTSKLPPPSLTKRYADATAEWSIVVISFPLLYPLLLAIRFRRARLEHVVMAVFALMIVAGATTATEAANPRYITALAWMIFIMFGSAATLWSRHSFHG